MPECCLCDGRQTVKGLLAIQRGGGTGEHPVCREHWQELEQAYALSLWTPSVDCALMSAQCQVCAGVETIEGREWLEYQSTPGLSPLCSHHARQLAECRVDTARIRTPPVAVNCSAVGIEVKGGN